MKLLNRLQRQKHQEAISLIKAATIAEETVFAMNKLRALGFLTENEEKEFFAELLLTVRSKLLLEDEA